MILQEFGVTSEGVFVFLEEALRDAGIDPKGGQKFTVKITGVSSYVQETKKGSS